MGILGLLQVFQALQQGGSYEGPNCPQDAMDVIAGAGGTMANKLPAG